ncbi:MAG: ParB N-terminal domain-containing protein [Caldilineaceae bacterium]|nr:ParB N-terminal domain-containing protein [Caldilineaceae bacterium]
MRYETLMMAGASTNTYRMREEFCRLRNQARRHSLLARLLGRQNQLLPLGEVQQRVEVKTRSYGGLKSVPLDQIRGSINRCHDFDRDFRPLHEYTKERWINIAVAYSQDECLPPVDLVEVENTYFVTDGHHRISVAKMMGFREIEAEVIIWRQGTTVPVTA